MYALPYLLLVRLHRMALDARRRDRTRRYFLYSILAGLLAGLLAGIAVLLAAVLFYAGVWWLGIVLLVMFAVPILEPLLTRHILIPLGSARAAYWVAHFTSLRDSDAYALCIAAWAQAIKPRPSTEAWIAARRDKRLPLGDSEIVVTALLGAGRGDAETARQLMRSVELMIENHPPVRELAGEWLAVDAAERGAWAELAADATAARFPATSLTYFLEGVAARKLSAPGAPSARELIARWLLAPHRRATAALRTIAPTAPTTSVETDAATAPVIAGETSLPRAVSAHLQLATVNPTVTSFAATVGAWDVALADPATRTWLAERALELDAPAGAADRALVEVTAAVTDELARIADRSSFGAPAARGPVGNALVRRLRHGRLDALESGFARWEQRRHDGAVRAAIDEWREFIALRASYDAAVRAGGLDLRRLAFPPAYLKGTSMAAWMWNTRKEYAVSHAISLWLRDEALAVGDTEAIELCTRNAKLAVPTR
ncbi:MAG: hypothetical protein JWO36_719 [Myxococcales bacterium]|nr:hypothetical protein [Myxococcales bacterium]